MPQRSDSKIEGFTGAAALGAIGRKATRNLFISLILFTEHRLGSRLKDVGELASRFHMGFTPQ